MSCQRQCRRPAGNSRWLVLIACIALGCRNPKPPVQPQPPPRWPGVALRIACPPGPAHRVLESHGKTWARDNGAKISLVPPGESADLVVLSPPEMPSWAAADRLLPLPDATVTAAFQPLYRSRLVNWDNRTYALPILGDGFVFVFRADLYADAALQAAFKSQHGTELTPPATWQVR